jgi:signal transduction histidine kinase/DNA-binding response OmpR family regulator/ligand-binding sensor domain-containing protein
MVRQNLQILLLLMALLVSGTGLNAQHPDILFRQVGELEDYNATMTHCIFQDSMDLIWIGTSNGLDQWDGSQIRNYPGIQSDSIKLSKIWTITAGKQNTLWITANLEQGTSLVSLNLETQQFSPVNITYRGSALHPTFVQYDPAGFLWLGCYKEGIFQYKPSTDSLVHIPEAEEDSTESPNHRVLSLKADSTGKIWISDAYQGLYCYDEEKEVLQAQELKNTSGEEILLLYMDSDPDGDFWFLGYQSELYTLNPYTMDLKLVLDGDPGLVNLNSQGSLKVDSKGRIWFGIAHGLEMYNPASESLTSYESKNYASYPVRDILIDAQENILVATNEGVKILYDKVTKIETLNEFSDSIIKKAGWITSMVRSGPDYWIGTCNTGLIRFNSEEKSTRYYAFDDKAGKNPSKFISRVLKDKTGRIWIMNKNGLHRYNPGTDDFKSFGFPYAYHITQDKEGNFWIAECDQLWKFDPIKLTTSSIDLKKPIQGLDAETGYIPFIRDHDGILWFGGWGLVRIDPETGTWKRYFWKDTDNRQANNNVRDILCDSRNRLWITTPEGVDRVVIQAENDSLTFHPLKTADGSLINATNIVEDSAGNICMGSHTGISVIRKNEHIESYTYKEGLPQYPRLIKWLGLDSEGIIYAGTVNLTRISPEFLEPNIEISQLLIMGLQVSGELILPGQNSPLEKSITYAENIELKHDQNFIRIDFSTPNSESHKNSYRYILEGLDKDTIYSGSKNYAEYTDLSPGKYTFWISGSNNSGVWNPVGRSIMIHVRPPWYRTIVALIIWDILIIVLIIGSIRFRTRKLNRDKTLLEIEVGNRTNEIRWMNEQILEMEALKTRFFYNVSHEFRNLISLIKVPIECLREEGGISKKCNLKLDVARRNTNKLANLVNQLLDISKIDKGSLKLKLSRSNICDFVHAIAVSYTSLAETKGIQYRYILSRNDCVEMFDEDKLEKIINNLLSNAFKFTDEGGKVILGLKRKSLENGFEEVLEITVTDTGSGIPEEEHGKIFDRFYQAESTLFTEGGGAGIGLALTYDLVKLMHGTIHVESTCGLGSTFTVRVPLGTQHLNENEFSVILRENLADILPESPDIDPVTGSAPSSEPGTIKNGDNKSPLILIVEDNAEILSMLVQHLAPDFRVAEAINGRAGLKIATEQLPDLVLTDLMMPGMDGLELCSHLKSDLQTSHIPVIMLTGRASMEDRLQGLESGADDYISKPFEIKEIETRIKNLVEQRRRLKDKFSHTISLDSRDVIVSTLDQKFLQNVIELVEKHMSNEAFNVTRLCMELHISRSTMSRKLNALTGMSPVEFIRAIRLQRAATLLKQQFGNVSQIALEVGFSNPSYFTRMFRQSYEVAPSKYARNEH